MDATRRCARPGCGLDASAVLIYDYAARLVWLELPAEDDGVPGARWGLCPSHAERLRVPVGWACEDRRSVPTQGRLLDEPTPPGTRALAV